MRPVGKGVGSGMIVDGVLDLKDTDSIQNVGLGHSLLLQGRQASIDHLTHAFTMSQVFFKPCA
jgi:hypothetical protein